MQLLNILDVHQPPRRSDVIFHQREQVAASGQNFHLAPVLAQQGWNLFFRLGTGKLKRLHLRLLDSGQPLRGRV